MSVADMCPGYGCWWGAGFGLTGANEVIICVQYNQPNRPNPQHTKFLPAPNPTQFLRGRPAMKEWDMTDDDGRLVLEHPAR